eukprot:3023431-Rhodomonas_salina.5
MWRVSYAMSGTEMGNDASVQYSAMRRAVLRCAMVLPQANDPAAAAAVPGDPFDAIPLRLPNVLSGTDLAHAGNKQAENMRKIGQVPRAPCSYAYTTRRRRYHVPCAPTPILLGVGGATRSIGGIRYWYWRYATGMVSGTDAGYAATNYGATRSLGGVRY